MRIYTQSAVCLILGLALVVGACGDDNNANEQLIGGECTVVEDCDDDNDDTPALECIADFKGGYCGRMDCSVDDDCPAGSLCADLEGSTYCFLVCTDKAQCNQNRTLENESNCSSSVDPISGGTDKLCIPPTGS